MINIQRRYDNNGFKIFARKGNDECKTDDLIDALAGACYLCVSSEIKSSMRMTTVNTGMLPSSSSVVWRSMSGGVMGIGPGGQVARRLRERNPF